VQNIRKKLSINSAILVLTNFFVGQTRMQMSPRSEFVEKVGRKKSKVRKMAGPKTSRTISYCLYFSICKVFCLNLLLSFQLSASIGNEPAAPWNANQQFRAGAAASNISPQLGGSMMGLFNERKSTHIHDELHARCLVLDDGQTRLAIVVCDSCMMPRDLVDNAKEMIHKKVGLAADHILISATHTHSAPSCMGLYLSETDTNYLPFLSSRIVDGVVRAINNLAPATIGWGVGQKPELVFNRRWRMKPGSIPPNPLGGTNELVRMNPPPGSPDLIEPAGPTDPELCVLSIQSTNHRPLALLANFSLHYVGTSRDKDVTADYFGAFCDQMVQILGTEGQDPPLVALLSNGTSGDINNINFREKQPQKRPYEQINLVADAVANEAGRVCRTIQYRDWVPLAIEQREIRVAVRKPSQGEIGRAEEIMEKYEQGMRGMEPVYARETLFLKDYPNEASLTLQVLKIGDLGIAAVPCEVFAEIGLEIKRKSPFKPTFTIELANGHGGYLPTPEQHRLGGYETWPSRASYLEVNAAPKIVQNILELFGRLK
jgi:hypothetical protein